MFSPSRSLEDTAAPWATQEDYVGIKPACQGLYQCEDHSGPRFELQPTYFIDALGNVSSVSQ